MNERVWFYVEAGTQRGPHTAAEMAEVVRRLGPSTLVWRDGLAEWAQAEAVPEFSRAPWPAPPGLPPVPGRAARAGDPEPYTLNPLVLWRRCFTWGWSSCWQCACSAVTASLGQSFTWASQCASSSTCRVGWGGQTWTSAFRSITNPAFMS